MENKRYILFVISDKAIDIAINPADVRHLIQSELNLEPGDNGWNIDEKIPEICSDGNSGLIHAHGLFESLAITDWLKKVVSSFGYLPLYKQREEQNR